MPYPVRAIVSKCKQFDQDLPLFEICRAAPERPCRGPRGCRHHDGSWAVEFMHYFSGAIRVGRRSDSDAAQHNYHIHNSPYAIC
jgi:hypothetical protein